MNSADTNAILLAIGYQADLDVNMDGAVDSKDSSEVSKLSGRTLTAGQLSDRGNIVGWCGYLYEESTGMWLARHRWQIPELGRWANRDPIGYAGGSQNLYEYVNGNPVGFVDPWGLSAERPLSNSAANIVSGAANLLRRGAASAKKCICKLISKDQWKEIALSRAGIHSDTLNAMIQARDSSVGMTPTLNRIYDFYAEMGEKGPEFLWYKAARHARGPILEAADKLHNSTGEFWTALRHQRGIGTFADRQAAIFLYRTAAQIFEDMSWQAVAYEECGIDAIRSVRDKSPSNMRPMYNEIVAAWELVVNAYDFHTYADAALEFVYIEQQYSAQPGWEKLSRTVALYASRYRAGSPYPGVMSFSEFDSDKTNSMRRFDRRHRYLKYATLEIMYLEEYNP